METPPTPYIPKTFCQEGFVKPSPREALNPHLRNSQSPQVSQGSTVCPLTTPSFVGLEGNCPLLPTAILQPFSFLLLCISCHQLTPASCPPGYCLLLVPGLCPSVTDDFSSWTLASFALLLYHQWFLLHLIIDP